MKLNFLEPKIYTGGVQISEWSKLTKSEKRNCIKKGLVCILFLLKS